MNNCNIPSEKINFTINIGVHVFILFCFLSTFFLLYITELSKHAFEHEIHEALEKGIHNALDNIKLTNNNIKLLLQIVPVDTFLLKIENNLSDVIKSGIADAIVTSETTQTNIKLLLEKISSDVLINAFYKNIHDALLQSIQKIKNDQNDSKLFIDILDADLRIAIEKSINDIKNSTDEKNKDLKVLLNTIDTNAIINSIKTKIEKLIDNNINSYMSEFNKLTNKNVKVLLQNIPIDTFLLQLQNNLLNVIKSGINDAIVKNVTNETAQTNLKLLLEKIPSDVLTNAFYKNIQDAVLQSIQKIRNNTDDSKLFIDVLNVNIRNAIEKSINDIKNSNDEKYKDLKVIFNTIGYSVLIDLIQIKINLLVENNINLYMNKFNKSTKSNLKLLLKNIPSESLIKYYEKPSKELVINNKWIKILIIAINLFLLILISSSTYLLKASCNQCVPIKDIIIENCVIFTFIGAVEFIFFKYVAIKYIPVKPSVLITSAIQSIQNNLK